jgi:hypothetical protein
MCPSWACISRAARRPACCRDEDRLAHGVLDLERPAALGPLPADQVLEVGHAEDVVGVLAHHRDAAEAAAQREVQRLPDGLAALDHHDVRPRDHHLADQRVPELEDRVDHVALGALDDAALLGQLHQVAQLGLGGERPVAEALAGRERVADQDEQRGQRPEHPGQRQRDPRAGQRHPLGLLAADGRGATPTKT